MQWSETWFCPCGAVSCLTKYTAVAYLCLVRRAAAPFRWLHSRQVNCTFLLRWALVLSSQSMLNCCMSWRIIPEPHHAWLIYHFAALWAAIYSSLKLNPWSPLASTWHLWPASLSNYLPETLVTQKWFILGNFFYWTNYQFRLPHILHAILWGKRGWTTGNNHQLFRPFVGYRWWGIGPSEPSMRRLAASLHFWSPCQRRQS